MSQSIQPVFITINNSFYFQSQNNQVILSNSFSNVSSMEDYLSFLWTITVKTDTGITYISQNNLYIYIPNLPTINNNNRLDLFPIYLLLSSQNKTNFECYPSPTLPLQILGICPQSITNSFEMNIPESTPLYLNEGQFVLSTYLIGLYQAIK